MTNVPVPPYKLQKGDTGIIREKYPPIPPWSVFAVLQYLQES